MLYIYVLGSDGTLIWVSVCACMCVVKSSQFVIFRLDPIEHMFMEHVSMLGSWGGDGRTTKITV